MPPPVILGHVAESCVDASLCCNGVGAGGKELGDARCFQARLGEANGSAEACTASSQDDGIVVVIDEGVVGGYRRRAGRGRPSALCLAQEASALRGSV